MMMTATATTIQGRQAGPLYKLVMLKPPFLFGNGGASKLFFSWKEKHSSKTQKTGGFRSVSTKVKAMAGVTEKSSAVKAVLTVKVTLGSLDLGIDRGLDDVTDLFGKSVLFELVSADLDPKTGEERSPIQGYARKTSEEDKEIKYEACFEVPSNFGPIGAIIVENEHHKEMFLKDVFLHSSSSDPILFSCNSWLQSKFDKPNHRRVFFTNQSYLPSQTPNGLTRYREEELVILRGNGEGERKSFERIYDYDVYDDLGNPDKSPELRRPVLGGKEHPYPRRCRTGRPRCKTDPSAEEPALLVYVPRDESFSAVKEMSFSANTLFQVLHSLMPSLDTAMINPTLGFPLFKSIDSLFDDGLALPKNKFSFRDVFPRLINAVTDVGEDILCFTRPDTMNRDKFFWYRDEEFGRQTLAGLNPYSIQLVTEWPIKSKLDPKIYGPPESGITSKMVEEEIRGFMTVEEAMKQKKLFVIDYNDLLLPYVERVREIKGTTLYGSRALFFLTPEETLRPLAIELTCPPMDGKPQWKEVYRPSWNATDVWLWRLAKAQFLAHDAGYHQLVNHWLRTHCCTEPYIITAHRQLSAMHPIYRLLHPHLRYTMEINGLARSMLINADGIIESSFSPAKYSVELSSVGYDSVWRFDKEGLPADLINRGMAVEDPNEPHGLKLTIKDYPFANDGLILWDCLKEWVSDYVSHYYPEANMVKSDEELQAWWREIRTVGHADKKDEPWWPALNTPEDLIKIITTIVWVTSGHHAAVNFGQYAYGAYFPNRATIARINMPTEDPESELWKNFMKTPEGALLECFPSQLQATKIMAVLDTLSGHSPDEEYVGKFMEPSWGYDPVIKAAYEKFCAKLVELEATVDLRNADPSLRNRHGAGVVPYELLKPFSGPGVTNKGVPYSISI